MKTETQNKDSSLLYDLVTQSLHFFYFKEHLADKLVEREHNELNKVSNILADRMVEWSRKELQVTGIPVTQVECSSWTFRTNGQRKKVVDEYLRNRLELTKPKVTEIKI